MTVAPSLLIPSNSSPAEKALDQVNAERWPLDYNIIRRAKFAWTCPEHLLPFLANEYSVDLWDETWPTTKKRAVIARAIALARIKGTEAAFDEAISIMGGKLLSVIAPPARLILTVTQTPEEKARWLARMPQLRIYPQRRPAQMRGFYVGRSFPTFLHNSVASFYATPRSTIWRNGAETELSTLELRRNDPEIVESEEYVQVREPRPVKGMVLPSAGPWRPQRSVARESVYTVRTRQTFTIPGSDRLAAEFAGPSLDPIDVRPELIREPAPVWGFWIGSALGAGSARCLRSSQARYHVFKRVHLYDPDVAPGARGGRVFLGVNFRFGMPAHNAELKVDVSHQRPWAAIKPFTYGYLLSPNRKPIQDVVDAITTHKSARDRIFLNTNTHDVITAGVNAVAGDDLVAGQIVRI